MDDIFKGEFKYYKRKNPPPDFSYVIDFRQPGLISDVVKVQTSPPKHPAVEGLLPVNDWKVYGITHIPGFTFIVNPFKPGYQNYWVKRCLQDYPCKPNICNLDAHVERCEESNIWNDCYSSIGSEKEKDSLLHKLRWVTLGYHHNWNTKEYGLDTHGVFPNDLGLLSRYVACALGYQSFSPEAAIVNYYHLDSTLAGHTDHSELDHQAPLLSFSFGQSAIFLLGGETKATKPLAMYLHSGDIVVMAKEARLAYHAVPRILQLKKDSLPVCFQGNSEELPPSEGTAEGSDQSSLSQPNSGSRSELGTKDSLKDAHTFDCAEVALINTEINDTIKDLEWYGFEKYLIKSRINMNVRQVLPSEGGDKAKLLGDGLKDTDIT